MPRWARLHETVRVNDRTYHPGLYDLDKHPAIDAYLRTVRKPAADKMMRGSPVAKKG